MANTLDIIQQLMTTCRAIAGVESTDVVMGSPIGLNTRRLQIGIQPQSDRGEQLDGDDMQRTIEVGVAAIVPVDPSSTTQNAYEQLYTTWAGVQDAMEGLIASNCNGLADRMAEDGEGVTYFEYEDTRKQTWAVAGCIYRFEIERDVGAATPT